MIARCTSIQQSGWLALRDALWTGCTSAEQLSEMAAIVANPTRLAAFVAYADAGLAVGLAEAALRTDYVNGARSTPVAFLEGLYVAPDHRRKGIAAALVAEVERWAVGIGSTELASDAALENPASLAVHDALGFRETERVAFFSKALVSEGPSASASARSSGSTLPKANVTCPACGGPNDCAPARSGSFDTPCWCADLAVDPAAIAALLDGKRPGSCLCRRCLSNLSGTAIARQRS